MGRPRESPGAKNHDFFFNVLHFLQSFLAFKASRGILGSVAPRTLSISPYQYGAPTTPFSPDLPELALLAAQIRPGSCWKLWEA